MVADPGDARRAGRRIDGADRRDDAARMGRWGANPRLVPAVGLIALFGALAFLPPLAERNVNVLIANASGRALQIEWQPSRFADMSSIMQGGCYASSSEYPAGREWRISRDGEVLLDSSRVDVPLFAHEVIVELRIAPDGSAQVLPAREADQQADAPVEVLRGVCSQFR